ncbi:MAG: hypothetical protein QOJ65_791 [Fimbriimonadaceae bacterium]|jgi:ferritin-like metal-binding protein YciE|nr:hypothetical protein [Fimbriimonadaceae bacterium]
MSNFHEMFEEGLKDIYNAEKQLTKALPKMAKMAKNPQLKQGFENHLRQTEEQCRRIEQACQMLGTKPTGMVCKGMKGLIEEATEHMQGLKPSACTDAELIGLAQKAEHYEIATYGTLCEWAKTMGHNEILSLLKLNMSEEESTDELLSQIAEGQVNQMAAKESEQMMMEEQKSGRSGGSSSRGRSSSAGRSSSSRSAGSRSSGSKSGGSGRKATTSKSKSPRGRTSVM